MSTTRPNDAPADPGAQALRDKQRRLAVLALRAKRMAHVPAATVEVSGQVRALVFRVADELYALESSTVRQVGPAPEILPLPGTPPCIAGVIKMLGEVVSVTDLRPLFGLPPRGADVKPFAVLLADRDMAMAVLAEEIVGVRDFSRSDMAPPMPTLTGIKADLLQGVTSDRIAVLDAQALATDKRLRAGEPGDQPALA